MRQDQRHAFQAIQVSPRGLEDILDTYTVTQRRSAAAAYALAEALCERARAMQAKPTAYVKEVNAPE
jgi:phage-related protein